MDANKRKSHQCIGEHKIGAFMLGGPAQWERCKADAAYLLDIKGMGGEEGYCCESCLDDIKKSGQSFRILKMLRKKAVAHGR